MKLKDKIKSYSFWVSLASAIILILKVLGNRFGFTVDETMVSDLFTALCSILVLLGIIVIPSSPIASNSDVKSATKNKLNITTENFASKDSFQINTSLPNNNEAIIIVSENDLSKLESETDNLNQSDNNVQSDINKQTESEPVIDDNLSMEEIPIQKHQSEPCQVNEEIESIQQDKQDCVFEEQNTIDESTNTVQTTNISLLKELFNSQRVKFTNNINEYILELQEEIRKAREQM